MNIYSTFYRTWKSEERSKLEAFLTHALTDLLRRITLSDPALGREFVSTLLLEARTHGKAAELSFKRLQQRLYKSNDLSWESQPRVTLGDGIKHADISLSPNGDPLHPLLVVEAKVSAKLSDRQLENYGTWLAHNYRSETSPGAALIFLTHTTAQPSNFLDERASDYCVPLRAVSSWMEIHSWLSRGRFQPKAQFLVNLIKEFRDFMSEHKLNGITPADSKFLRELLKQGVGAKIEPLFQMIRNHVKPQMKERFSFTDPDPWDSTEGYAVWDWCYREPKKLKWYVSWGLTIGGDFFEVPLPDKLSGSDKLLGFVALEREEDGTKIPISKLPKKLRSDLVQRGWQFFPEKPQNLCINLVDAQKLAEMPGGFTSSFIKWLNPLLNEADDILTKSGALLTPRT